MALGNSVHQRVREGEFSELRLYRVLRSEPGQHLRKQSSDSSFILVNREDLSRRCKDEKVVGDAQYADGPTHGSSGRRGRQQLSVLRLLLAQDDPPGTLLTASANRAHDDPAHDECGANSARNDS